LTTTGDARSKNGKSKIKEKTQKYITESIHKNTPYDVQSIEKKIKPITD